MAFADQEPFCTAILEGPLYLAPSLIESDQRFWLDDDDESGDGDVVMGHGWAAVDPVAFDVGLMWQTEFESDRIIGPVEVFDKV